ncbi:MAG: DUF512 domain-containing protein [Clostridia bacterium]|nr:DUF512 domain-containing protein [Clostridia bacterium]
MAVTVSGVPQGSIAGKKKISAGDRLLTINGHDITDVLDYRFYLNDSKLTLEIEKPDGKTRKVRIRKDEGEDIGLQFETYLMDKQHSCKNKCIFCFVDQLPDGLRDSLYFKDDDSRLSFFFGNYITLTNMSDEDIDRIITMHISPVNVSVHTMNPELRVQMMKNPRAGESLRYLGSLADAGIKLNTQLVLCPGINDGAELDFSLEELGKLCPAVQSIAAVPVGLTCHRKGLSPLRKYTPEEAAKVIDTIDSFNNSLRESGKQPVAFAADEFFICAGREIPSPDYYGDFPQLENGVGMWSLFRDEFLQALEDEPERSFEPGTKTTCVTGQAAYPLISELAKAAMKKFTNLNVEVLRVQNNLFGESVTVAGLLSGGDILRTARSADLGSKVLIPAVALRHNTETFLDDMTLTELSEEISRPVVPVPNDGAQLLYEMINV